VATICGVTIAEAAEAMGKDGLSNKYHLITGLNTFGVECGDKLIRGLPSNDESAIIKFMFVDFRKELGKVQAQKLGVDGPRRAHWVIWHNKKFYDPAAGVFRKRPDYLTSCNFESHLKVYI